MIYDNIYLSKKQKNLNLKGGFILKKKRILSLVCAFLIILGNTQTFALGRTPDKLIPKINIISPEFPNAYIEQTFIPSVKSFGDDSEIVGQVKAQVYVVEKFKKVDGKMVCTDSRLLSEKEVNKIGKENFLEKNIGMSVKYKNGEEFHPYDEDRKGKLTLFFTLRRRYKRSADAVYELSGNAKWDYSILDFSRGKDVPSWGDDFMGFSWGGGFDCYQDYFSGRYWNGLPLDFYTSNIEPNFAYVWGFKDTDYFLSVDSPMKSAYCDITIYKNRLTGNGNTTSAIFKYIHTYEDHYLKPTINFGSNPIVSGGFSLEGVRREWSLTTYISALYY